jgi:HAD superfamily phosphatase (TIGR01668 family)
MLNLFCPHEQIHSVTELDCGKLADQGLRGLIFDLDNTLVRWKHDELAPEVLAKMAQLKASGFHICLLSNARQHRAAAIADQLHIAFIAPAAKPRKGSFKKALELLGTSPEQTAIIGDQLFTDICGGNRTGLHTIWVKPLAEREFFWTRLVRRLEGFVARRLRRQGRLK